ncbi:FAD-dependent oxidoreductase [Sinorhizobium meliloti]|uniref:NAD(P)/FAD-dependent oxidoreductase n=1 Tax=Rhizobium meliloti TaxID=382 RepID=UPI001F2F1092
MRTDSSTGVLCNSQRVHGLIERLHAAARVELPVLQAEIEQVGGRSRMLFAINEIVLERQIFQQAAKGCRQRRGGSGDHHRGWSWVDDARFGVSACATSDGFLYRNKEVVVVGAGNTAVQEALYLSTRASKVTVVHRRDPFREESILQERLLSKPNVDIWNRVIDEVIGEREPRKGVTAVRIRDVDTGDAKELPTHGLFIGHDPATALFRGQLDMDRAGYIKVGSWSTKTSVPGVLAAGDVIDPVFRRAISAAGMGSMAALEAEKFLAEPLETREIEIIGVYG